MAKERKIEVSAVKIMVISQNEIDFICLTDMTAELTEGSGLIGKWISNKNTLEYLGIWEKIHNPKFNYPEFGVIEKDAGYNRFIMSAGRWITHTNSIGFVVKSGRYGGTLAKINYHIHTDAIKQNLIPAKLTKEQITLVYANETDVLNVALFGITAKQWREANPRLKSNIRDYATMNQLICLSNMENINAVLINENFSQSERLTKLNQIAIQQMSVLTQSENRKLLKG